MSEEQVKQEETPELTEIEQKAIEMGWKPQDEFEDEGKEWIPADEFVRRKPLFDKIEVMNRELKNLKGGLEAFKQHHEKVRQIEYQRAMEDLKKQRQEAIADQDAQKAFEVSDKMRALELERQPSQDPVNNPAFQEWLSDNSWYVADEDLREFADALGTVYAKKMTPPEVLEKVSYEIRKKFPEKFRNPNRERGSAVETAGGKTRPSSRDDGPKLTDMERQIMNSIVRSGVMTEAEYLKDLKRVKGL